MSKSPAPFQIAIRGGSMRIPASCRGEKCGICFRKAIDNRSIILGRELLEEELDKLYIVMAAHKVWEYIFNDDPNPTRPALTQYVCCDHFQMIMSQKECSHG